MFDLLIEYARIDAPQRFVMPQLESEESETHIYKYSHKHISICGVSLSRDDANWLETNDYILVVLGDLVYRASENNKARRPLLPEVAERILRNNFSEKVFQGNYWVIFYDKRNEIFRIISDPLSVLPLYKYETDSGIAITTNLRILKKLDIPINQRVFLELVIFNQPITRDTLLKGVVYLTPGDHYTLSKSGFRTESRFNLIQTIFNKSEVSLHVNALIRDFNHSVMSLVNPDATNIVSLTGGFDSRSIVSVLMKNNVKFRAFSFGKEGGPNTSTPLLVKARTGIDYEPIYLEREYEDNYNKFAEKVVFWSDGLSSFERANYLYVADKLRIESDSYLSGLVGGELFAPMTMYVPFCTKYYSDVFYHGQVFDLLTALQANGIEEYFEPVNDSIVSELESVVVAYQNELAELKKLTNGYLYVLYDFVRNGFRTFYGGQVHTERSYIHNMIPFYSLDLLERIMSSNYKTVFRKPFRSNPIFKRKNRVLQARIICSNSTELGRVPTDRGFSPNELLSPKGRITSTVRYLKNRKKLAHTGPEFTSNTWSKRYYDYLLNNDICFPPDFLNNKRIIQYMKDYSPDMYNKSFNRLISVARWLSM